MDTLEAKIRELLAIYPHEVIRRNNIPEGWVPTIKEVVSTTLLSGLSAAEDLLTQLNGEDLILPQDISQVVEKLARERGARCETTLI